MRLACLVALIVAASLVAACGDDDDDSNGGGGSSSANEEPAKKSMGFLLGVQNNPFYEEAQCWAQKAADERGYDIEFQAPAEFDARLSVQVMEALAAKKPGGLIVDAVFPDEMKSSIKQVIDGGIPVVTVQQEIDVDGQIENIVTEHELLGAMAADVIGEKIKSGKVYVADFQEGSQSTDARREGFVKALKEKYPDIEYVGNSLTGTDTTKAAQAMTATLQRHPDLKAVFGTNLYAIQGVIEALDQAGKAEDVSVVSTDTLPQEIDWLENDQVYALMGQKPGAVAAQAVNRLADVLEGKGEPTGETVFLDDPFFVATKENMNDPEIKADLNDGEC
jgi:ribose transport system substrate-binding protein